MNIVYATGSAVVALPGGGQVAVMAGSHWPDSDPVVQAAPSLFSADPMVGLNYSVQPVETVESATAVPGEKRSVRRG